jgi:hypothetical protein
MGQDHIRIRRDGCGRDDLSVLGHANPKTTSVNRGQDRRPARTMNSRLGKHEGD